MNMRKPVIAAIIVAIITAGITLSVVMRHRSSIVASGSVQTSFVVDGQQYCASAQLKRFGDGNALMRLENCSDVKLRLMAYNRAERRLTDYPIKRVNFAPHGYAEFELDSDELNLALTAWVNGREIPLDISLSA